MIRFNNFSYNFIKYLAMGLAFALIYFLFRSCDVKAANIDLSNPSRTCRDSTDGNTICNKAILAGYWDNYYFANDGYLGNPGSTSPIYKSINFQWDDINLCKGKSILITGYVAGLFDFFNNSYSVGVYNNDTLLSCSYSLENSSRLKYTCSGVGGGKFQINVNQHEFPLRGTYTIGVSKVVDISCDSSNADIITNNNNNTQNIINNNNSNTDKITDSINNTNDTMKDDNIDTSSSNSFFNNFSNNQHGLTGVINAPLKFIQSLSNNTCSNVSLTIPFVDETFNLPCFSTIYKENFNVAYTIYQVVISALVGYWVCVKIYAMVKGFKDPTDDRIEVMDL